VPRDPLADVTAQLRAKLERAGIEAPPYEGLPTLYARLKRELAPASAAAAREILIALDRWRYSRASLRLSRADVRRLRRRLRRFRPQLA
jgi:hypothetical protein